MKALLISITSGVIIALALSWAGRQIPELEPWNLLPGIILAVIIPSIHSGLLREAALLYNVIVYSLIIYVVWALVLLVKGNAKPH